ncbi:lasso peptide biosynthesis B2 protein [Glaciihabitans sp. UYNi722]|uniref:lasso peptide biosynthesis B2 protein n=1 Tax=Glaciihabitans sp. UYNi722 TaxID=3156344 RepID=UPI003397858B
MSDSVVNAAHTRHIPVAERTRAVVAVTAARFIAKQKPAKLERTLSWIRGDATLPTMHDAERARDAVLAVSVRCSGHWCLDRSVAIALLCRMHGRWPEWHSGICTEPFRAHAWVSVDGQPVGEPEVIQRLFIPTISVRPVPAASAMPSAPSPHPATRRGRPGGGNGSATDKQRSTDQQGSIASLWQRLGRQRTTFVLASLLSIVQAATSLAQPLLVGLLIGAVGAGQNIVGLTTLLCVLLIASAGILGIQQFILSRLAETVVRDSRKSVVRALLNMPFASLHAYRRGDLLSRATSDTLLLRAALLQGTTQLISGAITFLGALIAMFLVDLSLLGMTLCVVAVSVALLALVSRRLKALSVASQESIGQFSSAIERALQALPTIRSLNATRQEIAAIDTAADRTWSRGLQFASVAAWLTPVTGIIMQTSLILVLGFGGYRVAQGTLAIASLVSFIMYLVMLLGPLSQSVGAVTALNQAFAADTRLHEIELNQSEDDETTHNEPLNGLHVADHPVATVPTIEFLSVSFHYPDSGRIGCDNVESSEPVLQNVSFTAYAGERIGIVGPSGAGKSTILSLIERFYDPIQGVVQINGIDSRTLPRPDVRAQVGYVQQEAPILAGSIRDNLRLGAPLASDEDCLNALHEVNLLSLVDRSIDGLDARLGDQGVNLSGGERQRLALARIILADRPILLLDEATSQMDSDNELHLQSAIAVASRNKTQIVVAHRLSTVMDSDTILVLRNGHIEAAGPHRELVASNEFYFSLASQQHLV